MDDWEGSTIGKFRFPHPGHHRYFSFYYFSDFIIIRCRFPFFDDIIFIIRRIHYPRPLLPLLLLLACYCY